MSGIKKWFSRLGDALLLKKYLDRKGNEWTKKSIPKYQKEYGEGNPEIEKIIENEILRRADISKRVYLKEPVKWTWWTIGIGIAGIAAGIGVAVATGGLLAIPLIVSPVAVLLVNQIGTIFRYKPRFIQSLKGGMDAAINMHKRNADKKQNSSSKEKKFHSLAVISNLDSKSNVNYSHQRNLSNYNPRNNTPLKKNREKNLVFPEKTLLFATTQENKNSHVYREM